MNKSQLIEEIAESTGLSKVASGSALDAALSGIIKSLANGEDVVIPGFGTFRTSLRSERVGRNPKTGEAIQISATTVAQWKPGKRVKEAVNN